MKRDFFEDIDDMRKRAIENGHSSSYVKYLADELREQVHCRGFLPDSDEHRELRRLAKEQA